MSSMLHGFVVNRSCVSCMEIGADNITGRMAHERSLRKIKMVQRSLLEIAKISKASVLYENDIAEDEECCKKKAT